MNRLTRYLMWLITLIRAEMNYYKALYGYRMELAELERALGRK